jgi:drug/metabolite transporter (DMT)-like permease
MTPFIVLAIGLLAVSFAAILIKVCDAPPLVIASYRLALASVFFLATCAVRRFNPLTSFSRKELSLAGLAGLFLCLHFATWIASLKLTSVSSSVLFVTTSPIFVTIGSVLFLKEKVSRWLILGIIFTLSGAAVIATQNFGNEHDSIPGNLLALCGAVGAAGYFLIGRRLRPSVNTLAYVSVVYTTTAILLLVITVAGGFPMTGYALNTYILFALIAFVPQVIGHTSFNWSLKHFSAATVSIIILGEPVVATILAFMLLDEKIAAGQVAGGILLLIGVSFAIRAEA